MPREGKARTLNEQEFKRLLIIAKDSPFALRNCAIVYVSFGLGLRVKEIAALTFKDVIDSQFKILEEVNLKSCMTKGDKQRHIYLTNKKVIAALTEYIHYKRDQNKGEFNFKAPLFKTCRGSKFQPGVLQKWFEKLYRQAGIQGASSHSGRRTFITRLIEQGADIYAVSRLAGHSSIVTTAGYVQDNPERLKRISSLLSL